MNLVSELTILVHIRHPSLHRPVLRPTRSAASTHRFTHDLRSNVVCVLDAHIPGIAREQRCGVAQSLECTAGRGLEGDRLGSSAN